MLEQAFMPLHNPHSIVQILNVTSLEKVSIYQLLTRAPLQDPCDASFNSLNLWGL